MADESLVDKLDLSNLTVRERGFVRHYLAGDDTVRNNGTQSAIAAGYKPKGAHVIASRLVRKPHIIAAIEAFHRAAEAAAVERLRDWKDLAPDAQDIVEAIAKGLIFAADSFSTKIRLDAAIHILDRANGKVQTQSKLEVTGKGGAPIVPIDAVRAAIAAAEQSK